MPDHADVEQRHLEYPHPLGACDTTAPTQGEMQAIASKLDALIVALRR